MRPNPSARSNRAPTPATEWDRLATLLPRWLAEVPLYQPHASLLQNQPPASVSPAEFARLPFITKSDIRRDFPGNFLRAGIELEALLEADQVEVEHTAGTSEERTPLLLERGWWTRQEERALRLNPFIAALLDQVPDPRRVTLTSPVCNNDICYTGRPSRNDRIVGHALHVNLSRHPFLWSEADLDRMAGEAVGWAPLFLDVDPVYGVLFARWCERQAVRLPTLRFVLSSYEFLSVTHRRYLAQVFGVPVFNLYGSTETGHLLMEEETAGVMVPSRETAFLELLTPDAQGIGELVVSTLTNDYMPLIRYRIGDFVERREGAGGTTYVLHGRLAEACSTASGRRVTTRLVDACFAGVNGILHYQLHEHAGGHWQLLLVGDPARTSSEELDMLGERLRATLELAKPPAVEWTDTLLPLSSGKFRLFQPQPQ